jgi:hypothetical protein
MQPLIFDLGSAGGEPDLLVYCPACKDNKLVEEEDVGGEDAA